MPRCLGTKLPRPTRYRYRVNRRLHLATSIPSQNHRWSTSLPHVSIVYSSASNSAFNNMDFHITRLFRSIVNDIQLIADVIHITPQFRPAGKAWLEAFTEGLAAVVEREADEIVPVLQVTTVTYG